MPFEHVSTIIKTNTLEPFYTVHIHTLSYTLFVSILRIFAYYSTAVRTIHVSSCLFKATWKQFKPMLQERCDHSLKSCAFLVGYKRA